MREKFLLGFFQGLKKWLNHTQIGPGNVAFFFGAEIATLPFPLCPCRDQDPMKERPSWHEELILSDFFSPGAKKDRNSPAAGLECGLSVTPRRSRG